MALLLGWCVSAEAALLVRQAIAPGAYASLKGGVTLYLECRPPMVGAETFLGQYLNNPDDWRKYAGLRAVPIAFDHLNAETQRTVLLAIFPKDVVDERGWVHTVQLPQGETLETIRSLCRWVTGDEKNYQRIPLPPEDALQPGYAIIIPLALVRETLRQPTPKPPAPPASKETVATPASEPLAPKSVAAKEEPVPAAPSEDDEDEAPVATEAEPAPVGDAAAAGDESDANGDEQFDWRAHAADLEYGSDKDGPYALYRLKPGEALYTAVVVRFTDLETHDTIMPACERVQMRSGIKDVRDMKPGTPIKIPLDLLSPQFMPKGTPERQHFEEVLATAADLKKTQVKSKDLAGVVVILDPGHGGRDYGAANLPLDLYEDELNYDIVCRVKRILENKTEAKVYVTERDRSQGYQPTNATHFNHDQDEELLTTPPYANTDAHMSANLRWYMANSIYRKERARGVDDRRIIFTSFHCDKLYDGRLRGAMVYIPGARLRHDEEGYSSREYGAYSEVREARYVHASSADKRRDEALSRNFAEVLLDSMGRHRVQRHKESDPIRPQIRQDGGREYVPAVLRCNLVPTKVLVEAANLSNSTDCKRLADPEWREMFAEAYVDALRKFYNGN